MRDTVKAPTIIIIGIVFIAVLFGGFHIASAAPQNLSEAGAVCITRAV